MLLAQVESFLEVARLGHLGRAATGLFISQPTLTARLHALEAELGTTLFDRSRRGMALTDAGRGFLPHAERAAAALREGREVVTGIHRGVAGELTIGTAPAVGTYVLPRLLARFAELHPNVRLVVRTGHTQRDSLRYAMDQLEAGAAPVLGTLLNDIDLEKNARDDGTYRYIADSQRNHVRLA